MAAKESAAMVKARRLIVLDGLTAYEAARRAGITKSAIYMAPWYKAYRQGLTVDLKTGEIQQ